MTEQEWGGKGAEKRVAGIEKIERDRAGVGYRVESAVGWQEGPQHGRQQGWQGGT